MTGLNTTLASLSRHRRAWGDLTAGAGAAGGADPRLERVAEFGANPGRLEMLTYAPEAPPPAPAMVVVLHGCTQNAGYAIGAGWAELAERYGFVLVCPQQTSANNPKTCFNWFEPGDTARGGGEAASIRAMVEHAAVAHGVDRTRIFVTGLSAGGAMTAAMLAAYPDVFAGGAIVAGLPYGTAHNVQSALESMFQGRTHTAAEWGDKVRAASPYRGPWPKVSVWHGDADSTVKAMNAGEILKQWTNVHGLPEAPGERGIVDGHPRSVWRNAAGEAVVESFAIAGMGHGAPLAVGTDEDQGGQAGAFLLEVGISSSYHIAKFWGLVQAEGAPASATRAKLPTIHDGAAAGNSQRTEGAKPAKDTAKDPAGSHPTLDLLDSAGLDGKIMGVIRQAFASAGLTK